VLAKLKQTVCGHVISCALSPHPILLPQEKESLFPRLVNLSALRLRVVQEFEVRKFRGIFTPALLSEREVRSQKR